MTKGKAEKALATKILKATFRPNSKGRSRSHAFMYGKKGALDWEKSGCTEVHYDHKLMLESAFFAREIGAPYLQKVPINTIINLCTNLISENYIIWASETFLADFHTSYFEFISETALIEFSQEIRESEIFKSNQILFTFPVQTIRIENEYKGDIFSLLNPESLNSVKKPTDISRYGIEPHLFPPSRQMSNRFYPFNSWLCVTSPHLKEAKKNKAAILGALSLKYKYELRYQFNMVRHVGGYCSFGKDMTNVIGDPHTPSMSQDLIVTKSDLPTLNKLDLLLSTSDIEDKRKIKALEYLYRAWFLDESERYPFLFMCLESLYGDEEQATQSIINGVKSAVEINALDNRLRLLIKLRGSIVHGRAPEIYDSSKYAQYYKRYSICPSRDLGILVAACINSTVFNNSVIEQRDKHQEIIDKAKAEGKMNDFVDYSILNSEQS